MNIDVSFYVWASYALSAFVLLALFLFVLRNLHQQRKTARALEEMQRKQGNETGLAMKAGLMLSLLSAVVILGLLGLALFERPSAEREQRQTIIKAKRGFIPTFLLSPVPELSTPGLSSEDFLGRMTLLNIWASWCAPCRVEHPFLMQIAERNDVQLVGIVYQDESEDTRRFLKSLGNPFSRLGQDQKGGVVLALGIKGVPESFLVNEEGRILFRHYGPLTKTLLEEEVFPLLSGARRPTS